jgi:hypothetical protein
VTIYATHSSRGKTQILATYRTPEEATTSSTITSLDDPALAQTIADALNRVSACATTPLCVYDRRDDRFGHYPTGHLAALTKPDTRAMLLTGYYSLWYELVTFELHGALTDLDHALDDAPDPVKLAITQELAAEARDLNAELLHFTDNVTPAVAVQRAWSHDYPFIAFDGGMNKLATSTRKLLDHLENDATDTALEQSIDGLRLLLTVARLTDDLDAMLDVSALTIMDDPSWGTGYYLSIDSPTPRHPEHWSVSVGCWVPDDPHYPDNGDSTGESVVICDLPQPPQATDLVQLLTRSAAGASQHEAWAKTRIGESLAGTAFVVTSRDDSHR